MIYIRENDTNYIIYSSDCHDKQIVKQISGIQQKPRVVFGDIILNCQFNKKILVTTSKGISLQTKTSEKKKYLKLNNEGQCTLLILRYVVCYLRDNLSFVLKAN